MNRKCGPKARSSQTRTTIAFHLHALKITSLFTSEYYTNVIKTRLAVSFFAILQCAKKMGICEHGDFLAPFAER